MNEPKNPFILGHRIHRPYFCDRVEEQQRLISSIKNERNVVLISPRRMGKTSLIYVTISDSEEIEYDYQHIFIDILQTNSLSEFTYLLGKAIFDKLASKGESKLRSFLAALKSITGSFGFDPFTGTPTFNLQLGNIRQPEYLLEEIFNYIEQSDQPVILVIDEFQQITKYPEKNTEALLRSHIQRMRNMTCVFAGSERSLLQEMFVSSKRPFYNSTELMHLGPIDETVYVEFAKRMFSERNKQVEEEPIREAFRLFEGNTFYLQRTMNGAFADTPDRTTCDKEIVNRSIRSMLAANEVIFREILSNISRNQKSLLYAIAQDKVVASPTSGTFIRDHVLTSASSVQSALEKLMRNGYIIKTEEGYTLTDPLFRIFINSLYSIPEV